MQYHSTRDNPFPGIRSYEPEEDELFFGRESRIRELIHKLLDTRFIAIVGSSGCGKSSLIKAGLIPSLLKHKVIDTGDEWKPLVFRPGNDPLGNLAAAILAAADITPESGRQSEVRQKLLDPSGSIVALLGEYDKQPNRAYLIVLDQFEELFRFRLNAPAADAAPEADRFVQLFLEAANQDLLKLHVVLSMRTDFMDDCTEYTALNEAINRGYYLVPRMNEAEKSLAITGPLSVKGLRISPELVNRLLEDVGDDPDQLPIMQHALMRTFEHWSTYRIGDEPIDVTHYEAIGTMKEALSVHCEEVFNELNSPHFQFIAEKIFKALTDFNADKRGTRRPTRLAALSVLAQARQDDVIKVIDSFRESGRAFLMPSYHIDIQDDTIIDISHESIMRVWKRLRRWVDEESSSAQLYLRLSKSAELYQSGRTGLWVNPELQLALQWREANKPNATWATRYDPTFERAMEFLDYSRQQQQIEIQRKEDLQKRNLRRARNFAIILGAAAVVSVLFLIVSLNLRFKAESSRKDALEKQKLAVFESRRAEEQRQEAIIQKRISEQQQQIAEQQKLITEDQRKYAVSQQKIAEQQTREALSQKAKADLARQEAVRARDETEVQRKEAVSQKQIADTEREKAQQSEKNTSRLRMLSIARSLAVKASQLSLTVKDDLPALLAVQAYRFNKENSGPADDPDIYQALSMVSNDQLVLRGHEDAVRTIALSGDGLHMLSGGDDGKVLLWNTNDLSGRPLALPSASCAREGIRAIAAGKHHILAACMQGSLLAWKTENPAAAPMVIRAHRGKANCLVYDPGQDCYASAGSDGLLIRWKFNGNVFQPQILDSTRSAILSLAFDPVSNAYAVGCSNGSLQLIYPEKKEKNRTIRQAGAAVLSLAFKPGGGILVAGNELGSLQVWNLAAEPVLISENPGRHASGITTIAFNKEGKFIATAGYDRVVRVSPLDTDEPLSYAISKHDHWIHGVLFSPDNSKLISASADKTIRLVTAGCDLLSPLAETKITRNLSPEEWVQFIGADIPFQKTMRHLP